MSATLFDRSITYVVRFADGGEQPVSGFQVGVIAISGDARTCRSNRGQAGGKWYLDHWPTGQLMFVVRDFADALIVADSLSIEIDDCDSDGAVTKFADANPKLFKRLRNWLAVVCELPVGEAPLPFRAWLAQRSEVA